MQSEMDRQKAYEENAAMELAFLTVPGGREEQQDSFGFLLKENEGLAVVCDGMGGLRDGRRASRLAVRALLSAYEKAGPDDDAAKLFIDTAKRIDSEICGMTDEAGDPLGSGSTMTAVFVSRRGLIWCSVGDSRGYLLRGSQFVQFTRDQNYQAVIDEKRRLNLISEEEYAEESRRGGALISYLGVGGLDLIDYNTLPLPLKSGDKILLMTDGLYKLVPEEEIRAVAENFSNISATLEIYESKAEKAAAKAGVRRDNMTAAIIKVK